MPTDLFAKTHTFPSSSSFTSMGEICASWAFVGLHLLSKLDQQDSIYLGGAHLLGLLFEKAQRNGKNLEERLKRAENEIRLLKLVRAEDAKANEKVVAIFASHEQNWFSERKSLKLQIRALDTQLESLKTQNEESISDWSFNLTEAECELKAKDKRIDEETKKRKELEEKLDLAKKEVDELKDGLQKHKEALNDMVERKEKMKDDTEQKEKILSAPLRKSKLDAKEKHILLKEMKMSKARKKQAELEVEKLKSKWESRNKKGSRLSNSIEVECSEERREKFRSRSILLEYFEAEWQKEHEFSKPKKDSMVAAINCLDQYSDEELNDELVTNDIQNLQNWVRLETEKYATILEQKHFNEIEAFTEQMKLKDEKLEAFRWRLLSKDIESKRLQSRIEELEENLLQFREENLRLDALLLNKEAEIKSLKNQLGFFVQNCKKNNWKHANKDTTTEHCKDLVVCDITTIISSDSSTNYSANNSINCVSEPSLEDAKHIDSNGEEAKNIIILTNSPIEEIEEEKVTIDAIHAPLPNILKKEANVARNVEALGQSVTKEENSQKIDIHALGVSYKIKRLKQQLLMLEKLAGTKQITTSDGKSIDYNKQCLKGINLVIHLLNKQLKRFQSLEEKIDDLCRRMHENSRVGNRRDSHDSKEKSRVLENFLEETFQLQRVVVATGQKLVEMQTKITRSVSDSSDCFEESDGFNMKHFSDVIRTLFKEIQRGLDVRIARIIGVLEGTLACDGIRHI